MSTLVKICGNREPQHAVAAADSGADLIGMIFAPGRRQVTPAEGKAIADAVRQGRQKPPKLVGVFVNAPADEVNRIARECNLDMVQLAGGEPWAYCGQIKLPIIKVLHVDEAGAAETGLSALARMCQEATMRAYTILLDSGADRMPGGTGKTFDWKIAQQLSQDFQFLMAGGLKPETVAEAISIANPWGVDVSSGVETGGVKDVAKIQAFIRAAKSARDSEK